MGRCQRGTASSEQFRDPGGHGKYSVAHPLYAVPVDIDKRQEYE